MERTTDPELKKRVPEGFLKFGLQTHEGFDRLADKARAGGTRETIIKELAALTNNCVGCHGAYRVDEAR
jgi:cytochrome c556